jgi:hypothetical protein
VGRKRWKVGRCLNVGREEEWAASGKVGRHSGTAENLVAKVGTCQASQSNGMVLEFADMKFATQLNHLRVPHHVKGSLLRRVLFQVQR